MAMLSNLDLVRRVPLFSALSQEQAALVTSTVVKRRFKRGEASRRSTQWRLLDTTFRRPL